MSNREEELPLQMTEFLSKHNDILYFKHTQSLKMDYFSLIASQGVTVSSALL